VAKWTGQAGDRAGRVAVGPDLALADAADIFVIGDVAMAVDASGRGVPGVAPAAKQEGEYVGRLISEEVRKGVRPAPFRYRDFGSLATIGRGAAVVQFGPIKLTGSVAWLFWSLAHVYFLIGFRNRVAVVLDWLWAYLTFERGSRLITGEDQAAAVVTRHVAGDCSCTSL
jgi:NADH dehydrogenase